MLPLRHKEVVPQVVCDIDTIRTGLISIPIGRQDLIPDDYLVVDKRSLAPTTFCQPRISLRATQAEIVDAWESSGLLIANTSFGKTFTGTQIAAKLGQKTLVICHTVALRQQWDQEIQKILGIKAGIIGSGLYEIDKPITIANIQTLVKRIETNPELNTMFGTVIIDECHLSPAKCFNAVLDASKAKNKIGLTATPSRKDGKDAYLYDYFDKKHIVTPAKENAMTPEVHVYITDFEFPFKKNGNWANEVNKLMVNPDYREHIFTLANAYADTGHQVMVPADRVEFLESLYEANTERADIMTAKVKDRDKIFDKFLSHKKDILYGSTKILSTGISVNTLSCMVLTTPINNESLLTQMIGRILRVREGKKTPVIVDTLLKGGVVTFQQEKRINWYNKMGYKVKYI